jgi:hypothetical protein
VDLAVVARLLSAYVNSLTLKDCAWCPISEISCGVSAKTVPSLASSWPVQDDASFITGGSQISRRRPETIVLDDLLNEAYSRRVCDLFTKGSHHRNIRVILITQNLFHRGRFSTDISLNAKHLVVFKNVRDENQFAYLARQVYPEDSNGLYESYLEATRKPHGYLLLYLAQDTDDRLRFRTNIFPSEITVVYAPVGDETDRSNYHLYRPDCERPSSRIRTGIWCSP